MDIQMIYRQQLLHGLFPTALVGAHEGLMDLTRCSFRRPLLMSEHWEPRVLARDLAKLYEVLDAARSPEGLPRSRSQRQLWEFLSLAGASQYLPGSNIAIVSYTSSVPQDDIGNWQELFGGFPVSWSKSQRPEHFYVPAALRYLLYKILVFCVKYSCSIELVLSPRRLIAKMDEMEIGDFATRPKIKALLSGLFLDALWTC